MPTVPTRATLPLVLSLLVSAGVFAGETAPPAAPATPAAPKSASLEPAAGDDATTAALKDHFRKALAFIDTRQYEKAAAELQKGIVAKPNSKLIADLYAITVARFLDAALDSGNADLKAQAERLQKMAYKGRLAQLRDPKRIEQLVEALTKGFLERTFAMEELIIAGDYAVPHLVAFLIRDSNNEHRAYAEYVLSRLGSSGVPPLCEALKHGDPMIRQIIIQALEAIGDARAVPALLWLAQDPTGHPLVVAAAKEAITKTAGDAAILTKPACIAFFDLAQDYYYENQRIVLPHLYEHLVWRWDSTKNALASESVPRSLYASRMAEESARNALLADPKFEPAIPLLLCAFYAQQNLLDGYFSAAEGKALSEKEKADAEMAKPLCERLKVAPLVANAAGKKFVFAALARSLRDGRTDVAVSCINTLQAVCDGSALPRQLLPGEERDKGGRGKAREPKARKAVMTWYGAKDRVPEGPPQDAANRYGIPMDGMPLIAALGHPNKHVRYAAANALVAIAPTHVVQDADAVIANLAEAVTETAVRVALLVDEDNTAIDEMRGYLRDAGVSPELARTERDAISLGRRLPPKDVIILNGELQRADPVKLLAILREIPSLAKVAVLVLCNEANTPKLRKAFGKEEVTFVPRPLSKDVVRAAIDRVLAKAPAPRGEAPSTAMSSAAAASLASIRPGRTTFAVKDALTALRRAVVATTHPDSVRIPACIAIRNIGDPSAIAELANVYRSPKSSKPLRVAAVIAIGACSARGMASGDADAVLTAASHDADFAYRQAAALAYGLRGGASATMLKVVDQLHGVDPKDAGK